MNILFMAGREYNYPRNDVLLRAFRRLGTVDVIDDTRRSSLLWNSIRVGLGAIPNLFTRRYDLIFVGFYGHLLMLFIGSLTRSPVLFDAFVSTFDTLCNDRQLFAPQSLRGRLAFWLDQTSCHLASQILIDTWSQADYFTRTFNLPQNKAHTLPVGCNEDIFFPQSPARHDNFTQILYYSTYQPLHGVETVVRAASLLHSETQMHFKLIGTGPNYTQVRRLAESLHDKNITFIPFVPLENLVAEIAAADICLGGPFGQSSKAGRVIPGKIYQILAMARPLIATNTPANRELLVHEETAYLCSPGSAEDLATAILKLHQDKTLSEHLAIAGRSLYLKRCSESVITEQLRKVVDEMIK